ncbi:hypothetical protein CVT25_000197 [Psilocybe cyanescens]|uniref:F-box domain-containing protein n=1 Tax=Psilocybe cyanescens TaxID=93625 RepID=A0A409XQB2_PSICY|nr:hypothetical protein CVT25_000197 [Psilocybe cyanescens]
MPQSPDRIDNPAYSPHAPRPPPCDKCQWLECFYLHDHSPISCSLQSCDTCPYLAEIDEEISKVQNQLLELAKKRREIKRNINSRHDHLITRLPMEIVWQIFILSTESNIMQYRTKTRRICTWHPALLLGAVSEVWRDVTLSIPQLWTSVTINLSTDLFKLDVTSEWLRRSRALPLSITLMSYLYENDNDWIREGYIFEHFEGLIFGISLDTERYLSLSSLVKSHSTRWKCVHLSLPSLYGLLNNPEYIGALDYFRINAPERYYDHSFSMDPLCTENARYYSPAKLPLRWDNLTHLEVSGTNVDEVVQIICHAPQITHFTQNHELGWPGTSFPLPATPIINNSLHYVKTVPPLSKDANLLRYITLPFLRTFHYALDGTDSNYNFQFEEEALEILSQFFDRSRAPLDDFIFDYLMGEINPFAHRMNGPPPFLSPWLHKFPQITHLKFHTYSYVYSEWIDTLFKLLAHDQEDYALPRLRRLDIDNIPTLSQRSWHLFASIFPHPEEKDECDTSNSIDVLDDLASQGLDYADLNVKVFGGSLPTNHSISSRINKAGRPLQSVMIRQCHNDDDEGYYEKNIYDSLVAIQKSGISLKLIAANGFDILPLVVDADDRASDK